MHPDQLRPRRLNRLSRPPDGQLLLVDTTPHTCVWCHQEYLPLANRDDLGACNLHYAASLRQNAYTDPDMPF